MISFLVPMSNLGRGTAISPKPPKPQSPNHVSAHRRASGILVSVYVCDFVPQQWRIERKRTWKTTWKPALCSRLMRIMMVGCQTCSPYFRPFIDYGPRNKLMSYVGVLLKGWRREILHLHEYFFNIWVSLQEVHTCHCA